MEHWVHWHRLARVLVALALCAALAPALSVQAQIPPSVEMQVPKPPTVAVGSGGAFLTYELHVTNLTPGALRLERVDVIDVADDGVIATMADTVLRDALNRPGTRVSAEERTTIGGGLRAIVYLWVPVDRSAPPSGVRHRVTLAPAPGDTTASGAGAANEASHAITGAAVSVAPTASTIAPPLHGEWVAANGPSNVSGHRRLVLGLNGNVASAQRFGIDFVQMADSGGTHTGDPANNESYFAYGQDILAVADGVVVEVKDGIPENVPGPQSRAVAITLETVSGNSVVIDLGDGRFAFYAHLIPGSHRVAVGDRVTRGQVIGSVGNSGNSTEPHLHFHMVDGVAAGTSTLGAEGIPYALDRFEVLGVCTGFGVGGCERTAPVEVRGGIPLQNEIVRFP